MADWVGKNWFKLLSIAILLGALGEHPYSYYQLLRWVVTGSAILSAHIAYETNRRVWVWLFGIIAIIFNPITPFYLARDAWQLLDVLAAFVFTADVLERKK